MNIVFITGVSSGIGYDAMETLIAHGYHVIGSVRKEEDESIISKLFSNNVNILNFDVRNEDQCVSEISKVIPMLKEHGLSCLINNAGIAVPGPMQYLSDEDFETQLDVNVKSVRRITNMLLPYLGTEPKYKPGRIINVSSVSGLFNSPFNGAYCISKHALESMNDIYRRELAMFGIKVVAIEPGPIKTSIWSKNLGGLDKYKNTEYGNILSKADQMIENSEKSALTVDIISGLIIRIIKSSNPKTRYLVHRKKFFFKIMAYYLPDKWVDRLIARALATGNNYRPV